MRLSWSQIEGAFAVSGSRTGAIDTFWKLTPEAERTAARRRFVIALVNHIREYHETTGHLAPPVAPEDSAPAGVDAPDEGLDRSPAERGTI